MGQVAAGSWAEAWQGFQACLKMFFVRGDPYVRFNLPARPLFDPLTAVLFLFGLISSVVRWPRPNQGLGSRVALPVAARVLLLSTIPLMLLPSALATEAITPSNLRAVGLLPFVYVFPALALANLASLLRSVPQLKRFRLPPATLQLSLAVLVLALLAPTTARLYFRDWAPSTALYEAADGGLVDIAATLNQIDLADTTPYVTSIHYRHPTLAFLARDYPRIKWLTGGETLVFPGSGEGLLFIPRSAAGGQEWIEDRLRAGALPSPNGPDGQPAFSVYPVSAAGAPAPSQALEANFGNVLTLLGYDVLGAPRSGQTVDLIVTWRVDAQPQAGDLLPAVRLTDPWGSMWAEARPFHYPAEQWTPGEVILDHLSLPAAPGAPPGSYQVWLNFFATSTGSSTPVLDAQGNYAGTAIPMPVTLEPAVTPPDPGALSIRHQTEVDSGTGLVLLGYNLDRTAIRSGEPLYLTLFWQASRTPQADLTIRLQLGEATLYQGRPVHGTYPTDQWPGGAVVVDRYDPRVERDTAAGTHSLSLSLVDESGQVVLDSIPLGEVTVEATKRVFEPPPMAYPAGLSLGQQVKLLGYDLEPGSLAAGGPVRVTLYWQALKEMDTSYTVFVHLLGPDDAIVAQHDGVPAGGSYPTTLWVTGEVVADPHSLDLPAALAAEEYTLEIGMYVAETGTRLSIPGVPGGAAHFPVRVEP